MSKNKTKVGLIGCTSQIKVKEAVSISHAEGLLLQKISVNNKFDEAFARSYFPNVEIVSDSASVIHDEVIDLVLVSSAAANDTCLVAEVLQTGKHVRII
jgi:scyllo-inositol 2-dehydrogenase (NADP+)